MKSYALRFISGKYQGGEFPLPANAEVVVGRASDLDMVLVEDMVSRRHSKIVVNGDEVVIQDLGSTNGTFVNGERIKRATLREGDRVLIGTNIIKLVTGESTAVTASPGKQLEEVAQHRRTGQVRSVSGTIDEVPLPDLLQLFGSSRKTGVLVIRTDTDVGKVFLDEGSVVNATMNDSADIPAKKCVYRIMAWRSGSFYLEPKPPGSSTRTLDLSVEAILMEGLRVLDEVQRLGGDLLLPHNRLGMQVPLGGKLSDLTPEELAVLQCALNHGLVEAIFNNCPLPDLEIAPKLVKLVKQQYLRLAEPKAQSSL